MKALHRTGPNASAAADTFWGTRDFLKGEPHRTDPLTGMAGNAPLRLPVNLHQAEPVEPSVYGSQRTKILAERPVNLHGKNQNSKQNPKLPEKQPSRLAA